jgi:hypothetical protein
VLDYAPPELLADVSGDRPAVVDAYIRGVRAPGGGWPSVSAVPWAAFGPAIRFWLPFLSLGTIATVCLVFVLHGQWSRRERLRYPVAEFASELLRGAGPQPRRSIFRNRRFWIGFGISFGILVVNGLKAWFPRSIEIPLTINLTTLGQSWPLLNKLHFPWRLMQPRIFFVAVGFAYFVASDISFAVGISYLSFGVLWLLALNWGLDLHGNYLGGGLWNYQIFGSYVGMAVIIAYVGRRFYGTLLRGVVGLRTGDRLAPGVVTAARIGLLAAVGMTLLLILVLRMHWLTAVLFVLLSALLFTLLTRINAETGLIVIQPRWHAISICMGLFGFAALGAREYMVLAVLSTALYIDPRTCLMPMLANGLRLGETQGVRPRRLTGWLGVTALVAIPLGLAACLYFGYAYGETGHFWFADNWAKHPGDLLSRELSRAGQAGIDATGGFRFGAIRPDSRFLWAAGLGLAAVLVFSVLRLRYTWWPIHPILFLIWGTDTVSPLAPGFLLGWLLKVCIQKFGGGVSYRSFKPLFVGLVAGEFVAGLLWSGVGLTYHLTTGLYAPKFTVHPF